MSAPRKIDIRTPHFFARIATTCTVQYLTPSSGFVSSACQRINLAALGPDLEEGGNVVVSLVFVPRADDACFVPGDYADTHANGLGARKDAGGGEARLYMLCQYAPWLLSSFLCCICRLHLHSRIPSLVVSLDVADPVYILFWIRIRPFEIMGSHYMFHFFLYPL